MKLAVVLPRNMHFGPKNATSIDLCAYDYIKNSRFRDSVCVFHRPVKLGFDDVYSFPVPTPSSLKERLRRKTGFEDPLKKYKPDLILIEQHLPTAFRLASRFPDIPVVIRRHGFLKKAKSPVHSWIRGRNFSKLAAVVSVSNAVDQSFAEGGWGTVASRFVVHNGIDPNEWMPDHDKERLIVFAGRLDPEKGVNEAVNGTNLFLKDNPDWRAEFLCSVSNMQASYVKLVTENASKFPDRMSIKFNQPITQVQQCFSKAAVALVPSVFEEPFGRTAIEAMASEAALICSASGGMSEVVTAGTALTLPEVSATAIGDQISILAQDGKTMEQMGKAARVRVLENFDIGKKSEQFDDILETVWQEWKRQKNEQTENLK